MVNVLKVKYVGFETFAFNMNLELGIVVAWVPPQEIKIFDLDFINRKEGEL